MSNNCPALAEEGVDNRPWIMSRGKMGDLSQFVHLARIGWLLG